MQPFKEKGAVASICGASDFERPNSNLTIYVFWKANGRQIQICDLRVMRTLRFLPQRKTANLEPILRRIFQCFFCRFCFRVPAWARPENKANRCAVFMLKIRCLCSRLGPVQKKEQLVKPIPTLRFAIRAPARGPCTKQGKS